MNENDIIVAAKTVYGEARGESQLGKLGVAWVIRNRAQHAGWWGGPDYASVCLHPYQFSCWNDGDPNLNKLRAMDTTDLLARDSVAQSCLIAVLLVASDMQADPTGGATHYVVTAWLADPKLAPKWATSQTPTAVIGRHSFFRVE